MKLPPVFIFPVLLMLALPSCRLLQTPVNLLENMASAVGRSVGDATPTEKPIQVQQQEIEDARNAIAPESGLNPTQPGTTATKVDVASR